MSVKRTKPLDGAAPGRPRLPVVLTRWVLVIGVAYTVLFGTGVTAPVWPHQVFIVALLLSNLALQLLLSLGSDWKRLRWLFSAVDIAAVTVAVSIVGRSSADLYLVYVAVLLVATVVPRIGSIAALVLAGGLLYGGAMYLEVGPYLWHSSHLLVRVPFLLGIALYFGTLVQEARGDEARSRRLEVEARQIAQRAKQLAMERYRLEALSEIGRLGLSGVRTAPGKVLFQIVQRVQKVIGVDRCSLVVLEGDGSQAYVAASGDDPSVEVRVLAMEDYPELQVALGRRQVIELYPGHPPELWAKVQACLPPSNPFRSFLVVPIQRGGRLLGAFYLRDVRPDHRFSEDDRNFCGTASMMTAAFIHGQDLLAQLRSQSRRDGLTGLLNFQAFTEEADRAIRRRGPSGGPLSLVVADLDNLKEVNDRWGHMAGNRLIITVGHGLASTLDDAAAQCRYGGDEFVTLVPGSKESTAERLQDFLDTIGDKCADLPRPPRVSIGIAEYPTDGSAVDELIEGSDQAMYLAKNAGGHRIHLAGEGLDSKAWEHAVLEAVVSVQARRYLPNEDQPVEKILAPLYDAEDQGLDSPLVRDTLAKLMDAVEAKDPYTHAHSRAVARVARRLAEAMAFPEEELTAIEIAGLVHDVGKIGVPDEILGKRGKLDGVERRVVERHPEIAARLLEQIPPLKAVVPLVFHHQERWDGSGYPIGLKGDEIPPGAQVVAICDAYDALTSARAFRSALTSDEARRVIERDAGSLWNPRVVRVFLDRVIANNQTATAAG
ncbi:MAG: HD domain-containing phosphohydrolase [Acidobacteriota bacterium]